MAFRTAGRVWLGETEWGREGANMIFEPCTIADVYNRRSPIDGSPADRDAVSFG